MSKGNNFLKKSFSVPIQVNISQERWDEIFREKQKKVDRNEKTKRSRK